MGLAYAGAQNLLGTTYTSELNYHGGPKNEICWSSSHRKEKKKFYSENNGRTLNLIGRPKYYFAGSFIGI